MSKGTTYAIYGCTGFTLLIMIGCCGIGYWGWTLFTGQAKDAITRNAVIQHHIGEIDRVELDFMATADAEDEDVFVYRVHGDKGSGTVTAEFFSIDDDTEEILSGTLELDSGETYDLLDDPQPALDDELNDEPVGL